jgi:hypothetical protein
VKRNNRQEQSCLLDSSLDKRVFLAVADDAHEVGRIFLKKYLRGCFREIISFQQFKGLRCHQIRAFWLVQQVSLRLV